MKKGEKQGFWGEKQRRCACKLLYNRMKAFRKIQNSLPEGHDSKPCRKGTLYCPKGLEGKGLERETLLPFPRLRRFGTHCETGSKFLLLFSIKSKGESPCFAVKVLNGRMTNVVQPPLFRRTRAAFPILLLQISPERINIPHHSCQMYP